MSPTSANLLRTASAAPSGTPLRRSVAASCARVLGAAVSCRRQISRATASGSVPCPDASDASDATGSLITSAPPEPPSGSPRPLASRRPRDRRGRYPPGPELLGTALSSHHAKRRTARWPARRCRRRRDVGIQPRPDPQLLLDRLLAVVRLARVLPQVV